MTQEISDKPLGDVATKLLHEDDRVKIWEMALEPGQETAPHRHELEYIIVVIEGDRIAGVPHVESTGFSAEYIEAEVQPGSWYRMPRGGVELARNVGSKPYRELLIELKD
jgi:beta-alanine degradation protein BauB